MKKIFLPILVILIGGMIIPFYIDGKFHPDLVISMIFGSILTVYIHSDLYK